MKVPAGALWGRDRMSRAAAAEPEGAETWHLPHGDLGSILAESDLTLSNAEQ